MKVKNSLRSLKNRHRDCRVVRRKGRVYVINKTQRRFKARQGCTIRILKEDRAFERGFLCLPPIGSHLREFCDKAPNAASLIAQHSTRGHSCHVPTSS